MPKHLLLHQFLHILKIKMMLMAVSDLDQSGNIFSMLQIFLSQQSNLYFLELPVLLDNFYLYMRILMQSFLSINFSLKMDSFFVIFITNYCFNNEFYHFYRLINFSYICFILKCLFNLQWNQLINLFQTFQEYLYWGLCLK